MTEQLGALPTSWGERKPDFNRTRECLRKPTMTPDKSNLAALLHTTRSRRRVAELFPPPTWRVRKCSWTDYEAISTFAELVIEAESPILLHGPVDDLESNVDRVLALLRAAGVAYEAECYGVGGDLLQELRWKGD